MTRAEREMLLGLAEVVRRIDPEQLLHLLARLSSHERLVITLRYLDDLPVREVAVLLELPEGTVKSRIRSGLLRLRAALIESESVGLGLGDRLVRRPRR